MAEVGTPTNNSADAADAKGGPGAGRSKDEVALELMKFIAVSTGLGKSGQTGAGFSPKESAMTQKAQSRLSYLLFVAVALGAGVLSALLNMALAYGGDIMQKVRAAGGTASWAPFAVWPIAFLGGSIANIVYCVYLLSKNDTWGNFAHGIREVLNPLLAGCMLVGGIALFSSGTTFLGILGVSVGFALYTITVILCGQLAAIFTGEWFHMQASIYRVFAAGIACLFVAVVVIGASNYFGR